MPGCRPYLGLLKNVYCGARKVTGRALRSAGTPPDSTALIAAVTPPRNIFLSSA